MPLQHVLPPKALATHVTHKGPVVCLRRQVALQVGFVAEALVAAAAAQRPVKVVHLSPTIFFCHEGLNFYDEFDALFIDRVFSRGTLNVR